MGKHISAIFTLVRNGTRREVVGCFSAWAKFPDEHNFGYSDIDTVFSAKCRECYAPLPLGPSNDTPSAVQEAIGAASFDPMVLIPAQYMDGWSAHCSESGPPTGVGISWRAGWLSRENHTWDLREYRDADAWPWDPSRPVASQYEEWLMTQRPTVELPVVKWSADPDLDDAIRAMTPHDPTGSGVDADHETERVAMEDFARVDTFGGGKS